jgi:hypothetical protein
MRGILFGDLLQIGDQSFQGVAGLDARKSHMIAEIATARNGRAARLAAARFFIKSNGCRPQIGGEEQR